MAEIETSDRFFVVWGADNETTLSLLDLIGTCASTPLSPLPLARRRGNEVAVPAPRRAAYLCVEAQIDAVERPILLVDLFTF